MFRFNAAVIVAVLLLVMLVTAISFSLLLKKSSGETVYQIITKFNNSLDATVQDIDNAAKQVVFSTVISSEFLGDRRAEEGLFLPISKRRIISNELYSILGPKFSSVRQINLLDCNTGNYISAGAYPSETLISLEEIRNTQWTQDATKAEGLMTISKPHEMDWGAKTGETVISIARAFKNPIGYSYFGVVEVPLSMDKLIALMNDSIGPNSYVKNILVYDSDGSLSFALKDTDTDYLNEIASAGNEYYLSAGGNEIVAYDKSEYTGWTAVVAAEGSMITTPVSSVYTRILLLIAVGLIASLLVSYYLSNKFTRPLNSIYSAIKRVDFVREQKEIFLKIDEKNNEFEELQVFFEELCKRLDTAINEAVIAHSYERDARKAALEAQINPHFLYNTFAVIQSYADDANIYEISDICANVSSILRYAVSDNTDSTVGSEINVCGLYLDLMHKRNYDRLTYSIKIDERIVEYHMPRMILQPLVENIFKHGLMTQPRWLVCVEGYVSGNSWYINVEDNGVGFDETVIANICSAVDKAQFFDKSTGGIGLINIGTRLKLSFGDNMVFEIKNKPNGGSIITIGSKGGMNIDL